MTLLNAFGMDTDGALWTIQFLFQSACASLNAWSSDESVLLCVSSMLITLARDRKKYVILLTPYRHLIFDPKPTVFE